MGHGRARRPTCMTMRSPRPPRRLAMAEVLVEFNTVVRGDDGSRYTPRACTRLGDDGLWEGWIEFVRADKPGEPILTGRETEQHDRSGALYWARGLTQVYLEGALQRALNPTASLARPTQVAAEPLFGGPRRPSGSVA